MFNQHKINEEKEADIIMDLIFTYKTLREIAKLYRLNPKTIKRIVRKCGIRDIRLWRRGFYK